MSAQFLQTQQNILAWQNALRDVIDATYGPNGGLSGPEAAALLKRNGYRQNPDQAINGAIQQGRQILANRPPRATRSSGYRSRSRGAQL